MGSARASRASFGALAERIRLIRVTCEIVTNVNRPECPRRARAHDWTREARVVPDLHPLGEGVSVADSLKNLSRIGPIDGLGNRFG